MGLQSSRHLKTNYRKEDILGRGAFACVWKVQHKKTGDYFAAKTITKKGLKESTKRLIDIEIKILKEINHPNCCKLFEAFESKKKIYIIQELMHGPTLYERLLKEKNELSEWHIARVIQQIAQALEYLHGRGIVHRDLKPANIMFARSAEDSEDMSSLKLLDFGFAAYLSPDGYTSSSRGTPSYMAPEVVFKHPKTHKVAYGSSCDMWSLGVVMFELLAGRSPFYFGVVRSKRDLPNYFRKIRDQEIVFSTEEWQGASEDAKELILKLLHKNPKQRISSTEVLNHSWIVRHCNMPSLELFSNTLNKRNRIISDRVTSQRQTRVKAMIGRKKFLKVATYLMIMARMRRAMEAMLSLVGMEADKSLRAFCLESMAEDEGDMSASANASHESTPHYVQDFARPHRRGSRIARLKQMHGLTRRDSATSGSESPTRRLSIAALESAQIRVRW
eukprot:CAMPEP_0114490666 /NCGR_PEP_ID=MMETSP0109-20121206/2570_1 /TAXON_ID=29199 /ORGANISM="Chlorarachnion reptans, Strain CCCM449" /LENGTH=446 /DNA_ID=CAMNT_0001667311 /DNA_START=249 /DNA_END=1586 /DNA_ORIENTATION=+